MGGQLKKFQDDESDLGEFRRKHYDWELTEYEYDGFKVVRADKPGEKKKITPFQPDGSSGYPTGDKNGARPLYNLKELSRSEGGYNQKVIIVEGEKCVEHAEKVFPGCPVVTWAGGTGATDKTNWKPLQTRSALIIADTDDVGRNVARRIEKKLKKEDCTVTVYSREGEDGRDISDWIEGKSTSEIAELREEILAGNGSVRSDVQAGLRTEEDALQPLCTLGGARHLGTDIQRAGGRRRRPRPAVHRFNLHQGSSLRRRRKRGALAHGIGRTKGGRNTKLHAVCDAKGRPLVLLLTPGNVHDCKVGQVRRI